MLISGGKAQAAAKFSVILVWPPREGGRIRNKGEVNMNLSAPTLPVFLVSVVVAIVAVLVMLGVVPAFGIASAWLALIAYAILLVGNVMSGL